MRKYLFQASGDFFVLKGVYPRNSSNILADFTLFLPTPAKHLRNLIIESLSTIMDSYGISNAINDKIATNRYNSVTIRLVLIQENQNWRLLVGRVIFEITQPKGQKTLLKGDVIAIEDFSISVKEFSTFLEYLRSVQAVPTSQDAQGQFYKLGNYTIDFAGGYSSNALYFLNRQSSEIQTGIDRPLYYVYYSLSRHVVANAYQQIDLSWNEIPFRNVAEAINYFWQTNYDFYQLSNANIGFFLPTYDASIKDCDLQDKILTVNLEINKDRVNINELLVSIIAEINKKSYRKIEIPHEETLHFDLGFRPSRYTVILNKKKEKIDEFDHQVQPSVFYSPPQIQIEDASPKIDSKTTKGKSRKKTESYPKAEFTISTGDRVRDISTGTKMVNEISIELIKGGKLFHVQTETGSFEIIIEILYRISENPTVAAMAATAIGIVMTRFLENRSYIPHFSFNTEWKVGMAIASHVNRRQLKMHSVESIQKQGRKLVVRIRDNENTVYSYVVDADGSVYY